MLSGFPPREHFVVSQHKLYIIISAYISGKDFLWLARTSLQFLPIFQGPPCRVCPEHRWKLDPMSETLRQPGAKPKIFNRGKAWLQMGEFATNFGRDGELQLHVSTGINMFRDSIWVYQYLFQTTLNIRINIYIYIFFVYNMYCLDGFERYQKGPVSRTYKYISICSPEMMNDIGFRENSKITKASAPKRQNSVSDGMCWGNSQWIQTEKKHVDLASCKQYVVSTGYITQTGLCLSLLQSEIQPTETFDMQTRLFVALYLLFPIRYWKLVLILFYSLWLATSSYNLLGWTS